MPLLPSTADRSADSVAFSMTDRLAALDRVRLLLLTERAQIRSLLTEVATYRAAEYEIDVALATLAGAADEIHRHDPPPVARQAVFMPSNVLLYSYVLYLLVPSLFVDRICFRPSQQISEPLLRLHDLLAPVHGLPVTPMAVSQRAFMRDGVAPADVVVFTGTYQNAELIRPQLRADQVFIYLGSGVNPFVVAPGADLDRAVSDAIQIRLLNSGQDCLAPDLFVINQDDLDSFVDRLVNRLVSLRFGPRTDAEADYGPIYYQGALEQAALHLFRHERELVHGGRIDLRRRQVEPTVLRGTLHSKSGATELFAPVFHVVGYHDEAALASRLTHGGFAERAMGASVYGHAPGLVEALSRWHTVTVDQTLLAVDDGNAPFGGRGPMANYVAYGGRLHAEPVLLSKAVAQRRRDARTAQAVS